MKSSLDFLDVCMVMWTRDILDPAPTPDHAIFVVDLQDRNYKLFFSKFFAYYFLKTHLHHFSKKKVIKSHKKVGIKVFLSIFA
jgi:hypothetical protein